MTIVKHKTACFNFILIFLNKIIFTATLLNNCRRFLHPEITENKFK